MPRPNTITTKQAVSVLTEAAGEISPSVEAQLKAAGFGTIGHQSFPGTTKLDAAIASDVGTAIEGRGIYHGTWQPRPSGVIVYAYSDTDFLRDKSDQQLLLNWYKAGDELARRNDGRVYGDGTEPALRQALAKPSGMEGAYQDGDQVMAPERLLNGRDIGRKQVRAGRNTSDLFSRSKGAFQKVSETLENADSRILRYTWTCTDARGDSSSARAVRLQDGSGGGGFEKDGYKLAILPFRFFRESHAVKSHLAL